jgi:hypothetical protein
MNKWLVILMSSLWILPAQAEKAYKWVDAEGNVQISQTPPPTGAKDVKQMDLPKALMPNNPPPAPKTTSPEKKEEKSEEKPKQPPVDVTKMTPEQLHEHNCSSAKRHLDMLKSNEKIVIPDKEDSKKLQLASSEQRNAEIKKAEEMADKFCNAPPPIASPNSTNAQPQNANEKKPDNGSSEKPAEKTEKK